MDRDSLPILRDAAQGRGSFRMSSSCYYCIGATMVGRLNALAFIPKSLVSGFFLAGN
jgi:hypothetical protein